MGKFVLAVRTRPVPGSEEDYHEWYDKYHLDEVLAIPDFVTAERFEWWDGDHRASAGQETTSRCSPSSPVTSMSPSRHSGKPRSR